MKNHQINNIQIKMNLFQTLINVHKIETEDYDSRLIWNLNESKYL